MKAFCNMNRWTALFAAVLLMVAISAAYAQKSDADPRLVKAKQLYKDAKYDEAIDALTKISGDASMAKPDRKETFLLLSRTYLAKDLMEKAKNSISNMLELEPPIIAPDPDNECPPFMKLYYQVRKDASGGTMVERADPGIKTIAVLDFKNRSIDDKEKFDPMEKGFAELLINELNGSVNLKIVERERIQWILEEIGMENDPGKFDQSTAVRVGKQLGVHSILIGSFIKMKDQIKLLARLVKVETSEILATEEETGDADEFFVISQKLSDKIAKKINVTLGKIETKPGSETKSLDAMMAYSEGLVFLEKGNYKMAYEKFMDALKLDPSYEKAKMKAESLKPLLG